MPSRKQWIWISVFFIVIILILGFFLITDKQPFTTDSNYHSAFNNKENRMFPFRYFTDKDDNVLPIVAVTGPFRDDDAKKKYYEYKENNIRIFGITAYKTFPNNKMYGKEEGEYERNDDFDYVGNITSWLCCFKDKDLYGFSIFNHTENISESDFYTAEDEKAVIKKYDFIYICNKDDDTCPRDGWNAVNRNYDLAVKCFPILCNELQLKGLIVGRVGCGLEKIYGNKLEVVDWLEWGKLQEKMQESKILFVPNIYDASPRVVAECITKDVAVLMNKNILCGSKYITYETGEFFTDETDLKAAVSSLQNRLYKISPKKWWAENYSQEISQKKLCSFLKDAFPEEESLKNIDRVKFIL